MFPEFNVFSFYHEYNFTLLLSGGLALTLPCVITCPFIMIWARILMAVLEHMGLFI
jgi:hypothetical protein